MPVLCATNYVMNPDCLISSFAWHTPYAGYTYLYRILYVPIACCDDAQPGSSQRTINNCIRPYNLRPVTEPSERRCQNIWNRREQVKGENSHRPYWAWEPTKCSLDAVSEEKLCRVLEGRKGLLLVGESQVAKRSEMWESLFTHQCNHLAKGPDATPQSDAMRRRGDSTHRKSVRLSCFLPIGHIPTFN